MQEVQENRGGNVRQRTDYEFHELYEWPARPQHRLSKIREIRAIRSRTPGLRPEVVGLNVVLELQTLAVAELAEEAQDILLLLGGEQLGTTVHAVVGSLAAQIVLDGRPQGHLVAVAGVVVELAEAPRHDLRLTGAEEPATAVGSQGCGIDGRAPQLALRYVVSNFCPQTVGPPGARRQEAPLITGRQPPEI